MKKNWLIIGSVAQRHWFPDSRIPSDIDLLSPVKITGNQSNVCVVDSQWHEVAQKIIDSNKDEVFLSPDGLYTMKLSHAHWDVKWTKTMYDIHFLQQRGCKKIDWMYEELLKVWEEVHGEKKVNLKQSIPEFFNDAVIRKYDHEELHKLAMFGDKPGHEKIRRDSSSVWCSCDLWDSLLVKLKDSKQSWKNCW